MKKSCDWWWTALGNSGTLIIGKMVAKNHHDLYFSGKWISVTFRGIIDPKLRFGLLLLTTVLVEALASFAKHRQNVYLVQLFSTACETRTKVTQLTIFPRGYDIFWLRSNHWLLEDSTQAVLGCCVNVLERISMIFFHHYTVDVHRVTVRLTWIRQISKSNESPCEPSGVLEFLNCQFVIKSAALVFTQSAV